MRVGAQWILSRENLEDDSPGWVGVGFIVSDAGILVLLALTVLGWLALRRTRVAPWFAGLASIYLVALGVAWFAMSAKARRLTDQNIPPAAGLARCPQTKTEAENL